MAGIYLHIPFCKQACFYCDFHFSVNPRLKNDMVLAICTELELQKSYLTEKVNTIYFGGGTPSLLETDQIKLLLETIHTHFEVQENPEVTFEANPDDVTEGRALDWFRMGINRISLGVQSFAASDLKWMNRAHTSQEAESSIKMLQHAGFSDLNLDLIYGLPEQNLHEWNQNLRKALLFGPTHLSCYALIVEEKTPLHKLIRLKKYLAPKQEAASDHFNHLMSSLEAEGWNHYEISNFSVPGYESQHNKAYWERIPYLGVGPSAHSYNGETRQWNVSHNKQYLDSIKQEFIPHELEILSLKDKVNEYLLTGLRTKEGCHWDQLNKLIPSLSETILNEAAQLNPNHYKTTTKGISLTKAGKHFADAIAASLFVE